MGKQPGFYFYPNDWNRDMEEYPLEIQGAWIVLLCKLWWSETRGSATKNLAEWSRILREKKKKTEKILHFLSKNCIANISGLDNQNPNQNITITCRRMVRDHQISQLRQQVGKLGGNPQLKQIDQNLDNQNPNQKCPSPIPIPIPIPSSKKKNKPPTPLIILPDWLSPELWEEFKEHRKDIKKGMSVKAERLALNRLIELKAAGEDIKAVIEQSIFNHWQGLFPLKSAGITQTEDPGKTAERIKAELIAKGEWH